MKNILLPRVVRPLLCLCAFALIPFSTFARDFTYQGINYTVLSEENAECQTQKGRTYSTAGNKLSGDITLPETVYDGTKAYTLVGIGDFSFYENNDLKSIILPGTIRTIGEHAFYRCENLTDLNLPRSVKSIGQGAFSFCESWKGSVAIPDGVTAIGERTFSYCKKLTSINIPNTITSIGKYAFMNCDNLKEISIPESVTEMGESVFAYCHINKLIMYCRLSSYVCLKNLHSTSTIYCHADCCSDINRAFSGSVISFSQPYDFTITGEYLCGVKFKLHQKNELLSEGQFPQNISFEILNGNDDVVAAVENPEFGKVYFIKGLQVHKGYTLRLKWNENEYVEKRFTTLGFSDLHYEISYAIQTTQTTATLKSIRGIPADESCTIIAETDFAGSAYTEFHGTEIKKDNLTPDTKYYFSVKLRVSGTEEVSGLNRFDYRTKNIGIFLDKSKITPTIVEINGKCNGGDAHIVETWWEFSNEKIFTGSPLKLTGLAPDTDYGVAYHAKTDKGYETWKAISFKTPKLELETLQPRGTSATTSIVAATTNISDIETNVGFQWKKYDAPQTLKPNEGYAAIYDGVLEGHIKNLQTDKYYNVRAFYKDRNDKYYYSGWVTFDPSDFSYFEPTVHTYPIEAVGADSATLRGYALSGTDNVVSQGFQYWIGDGPQAMPALGAPATGMTTVTAGGQQMMVTIGALRPETTYIYRAFVETPAGFTYGEEQSFTTKGVSGIDNVSIDTAQPEIIAYYDINGMRHSRPCRGLNIIVYSDGSTRKLILK